MALSRAFESLAVFVQIPKRRQGLVRPSCQVFWKPLAVSNGVKAVWDKKQRSYFTIVRKVKLSWSSNDPNMIKKWRGENKTNA